MLRISRYVAIVVLFLGVMGVVMGSVFIAQAVEKNSGIILLRLTKRAS